MGMPSTTTSRSSSFLRPRYFLLLAVFTLAFFILLEVDSFVSKTKTIVGHNLEPTPWHPFPPKKFDDESRYKRTSKILQCAYLTCRSNNVPRQDLSRLSHYHAAGTCPEFFQYIHRDLEPWSGTGISLKQLMEAKNYAALRVVIVGGKLYVENYYACFQSRSMITVWGLLQLLRRYPGMIPDVDLMFDCMDKPNINRTDHKTMPLPLFRYCTTTNFFDIPFPDWSFWGWPEINIEPWVEQFMSIKRGSQARSWEKKWPFAYWRGNANVASPLRLQLTQCNDTKQWGAQILNQDWFEEDRLGFKHSKLSDQCNHRYKIYTEGFAWSVSLKYIMSCGATTLIVSPEYQDFFSRALVPKKHFLPVPRTDLCSSIKSAVDWGNKHPAEAEAIGIEGQNFMGSLSMDQVYAYMYHLISEYSKLLDFKVVRPWSAQEVCEESIFCFADEKQKAFLQRSSSLPSRSLPCSLPR